jgi:hypothetical protein
MKMSRATHHGTKGFDLTSSAMMSCPFVTAGMARVCKANVAPQMSAGMAKMSHLSVVKTVDIMREGEKVNAERSEDDSKGFACIAMEDQMKKDDVQHANRSESPYRIL